MANFAQCPLLEIKLNSENYLGTVQSEELDNFGYYDIALSMIDDIGGSWTNGNINENLDALLSVTEQLKEDKIERNNAIHTYHSNESDNLKFQFNSCASIIYSILCKYADWFDGLLPANLNQLGKKITFNFTLDFSITSLVSVPILTIEDCNFLQQSLRGVDLNVIELWGNFLFEYYTVNRNASFPNSEEFNKLLGDALNYNSSQQVVIPEGNNYDFGKVYPYEKILNIYDEENNIIDTETVNRSVSEDLKVITPNTLEVV